MRSKSNPIIMRAPKSPRKRVYAWSDATSYSRGDRGRKQPDHWRFAGDAEGVFSEGPFRVLMRRAEDRPNHYALHLEIRPIYTYGNYDSPRAASKELMVSARDKLKAALAELDEALEKQEGGPETL